MLPLCDSIVEWASSNVSSVPARVSGSKKEIPLPAGKRVVVMAVSWKRDDFYKFCEIYKDIKLPFWIQTRPETVKEDLFKMLKENMKSRRLAILLCLSLGWIGKEGDHCSNET